MSISRRLAMTLTAWSRRFKNFSGRRIMTKSGMVSDEFATVMQQLSAEAEKSIPVPANQSVLSSPNPVLPAVIEDRLRELERSVSKKLDELAGAVAKTQTNELADQLGKIQ